MPSVVMLSAIMLNVTYKPYMLCVFMLSVVMHNDMLNVVMLSVVVPNVQHLIEHFLTLRLNCFYMNLINTGKLYLPWVMWHK
jgi:hypothetical protein